MMAAASDVSMATGSGNCASNRQVNKHTAMCKFFRYERHAKDSTVLNINFVECDVHC